MHVEFETQPLLNKEEVPLLWLLEDVVRSYNAGLRVMAQTSLGEIIRPKTRDGTAKQRDLAYRSINSKRLDFAVFSRSGRLILAVEYQGSGHYHRTSFMRDAVKKEALRKAGVPFITVNTEFDTSEITRRIRKAIEEHLSVSN